MKSILASSLLLTSLFAISHPALAHDPTPAKPASAPAVPTKTPQWQDAKIDLAAFNSDLVRGPLTADIVVYVPTNFDAKFNKVSLPLMLDSLRHAKAIFRAADVQLRLKAVRIGAIDPRHLQINANPYPTIPDTEYINSYQTSQRHPTPLSDLAHEAFDTIIEPDTDNPRTIYLIALQDVFMPFIDPVDERNWTIKMVRTGGLSFPSYSYGTTIPNRLRGVMTITNLSTPNRLERTVAHELGHKLINVSHEYRTTDPAHEVRAEGGLMLYGNGTDIESGPAGRFHKERLHVSPYLYRMNAQGQKIWNADYQDGGHYYDPIYGQHVVHFSGAPSRNPDW